MTRSVSCRASKNTGFFLCFAPSEPDTAPLGAEQGKSLREHRRGFHAPAAWLGGNVKALVPFRRKGALGTSTLS